MSIDRHKQRLRRLMTQNMHLGKKIIKYEKSMQQLSKRVERQRIIINKLQYQIKLHEQFEKETERKKMFDTVKKKNPFLVLPWTR